MIIGAYGYWRGTALAVLEFGVCGCRPSEITLARASLYFVSVTAGASLEATHTRPAAAAAARRFSGALRTTRDYRGTRNGRGGGRNKKIRVH